MHDFDLLIARSTADLAQMLADTQGRVLAGGTDLILFMESGRVQPATVIDISRLDSLRYLRGDAGQIRIGPLTTHTELMQSPLLREWAPILPMAAATIGAVQIRNRGTIGGNIGTASPAGDLLPALVALDAAVTLRSRRSERRLSLHDFFLGPGKTALAVDEYIAEIDFATPCAGASGVYIKAGRRKAQAITLVSVGVQVAPDHGRVGETRIALGAVAPTIVRATGAENAVRGQAPSPDLWQQAAAIAAGEVRPIDDIRASAGYRRSLVQTWVRRALESSAADMPVGRV